MPTFSTTVISGGGDTAGIEIPEEVMTALGGKRVPVVVTLDGAYSYRNTTAVMGGRNLVGISKEHRAASGVAVGHEISVTLERDDAPREVEVPADLAVLLAADPPASAAWDALAYSRRKEHARSITDAKSDATRQRRLEKVLAALRP